MQFELDRTNTDSIIYYYYKQYDFYKENKRQNDAKRVFLSKEPNISSVRLSSNYKSTNLYISKKVHRIKGIDFDGELIIEHIPITNGFSKLYFCIPLKTRSGSFSLLDDLIKKSKDITLSLNTILPLSSNGILYSSNRTFFNEDHVILLTEPIFVDSNFESVPKVDLFQDYVDDYSIVSIEQYKEPIVENFEGSSGNIYCQPVDMNDPTNTSIDNVATMTIPLGGADGKIDSTGVIMNLVNNFGMFFIVLLGLWFLVPQAYTIFLVEHIQSAQINTELTMKDKAARLYASEILISSFLLILSISFIYTGTASSNSNFAVIGFFTFISFIIIFLRVQYIKMFENSGGSIGYLKSVFSGSAGQTASDLDLSLVTPDFYGAIVLSLTSLLTNKQIITVAILFVAVFCIAYFTGLKNISSIQQVLWGIIIAIFSIFVGVYAASMMPKSYTEKAMATK